jgi:hypothetical protein
MLKKFYTEFKTWAEGDLSIPWPCARFEELPDYRLRSDLTVPASAHKIKGIFLAQDEKSANNFLREYVCALVCGVILELDTPENAENTIKSVFGSCELLGIMEITHENQAEIQAVMSRARIN